MRFAQIAYDAYKAATGGKSLVSGDPLPEFESLSPGIQAAWDAAAKAARQASSAEVNAEGRAVVTLRRPIKFGAETVSVLALREPVAKDMRDMPAQAQTVGHSLDLIAKLSGQSFHVIDKLGMADLAEVSAVVESFTEDTPAIGSGPSAS